MAITEGDYLSVGTDSDSAAERWIGAAGRSDSRACDGAQIIPLWRRFQRTAIAWAPGREGRPMTARPSPWRGGSAPETALAGSA